jgi:hypothetical protein
MQAGCNAVLSHCTRHAKACCTLPYRKWWPCWRSPRRPPATHIHHRRVYDILPIWVTKTMESMWASHPHFRTSANVTSIVQRQEQDQQDQKHTERTQSRDYHQFFLQRFRVQLGNMGLHSRPKYHLIHPFALRVLYSNTPCPGARNHCIFANALIACSNSPY